MRLPRLKFVPRKRRLRRIWRTLEKISAWKKCWARGRTRSRWQTKKLRLTSRRRRARQFRGSGQWPAVSDQKEQTGRLTSDPRGSSGAGQSLYSEKESFLIWLLFLVQNQMTVNVRTSLQRK